MTEETKIERSDPAPQEGTPIKAERAPSVSARVARPTDRWSIRSAELKRQKRRAHKRRINASNRPG